jgi:hypothetical protein
MYLPGIGAPDSIRFVNTGKMAVGANGTAVKSSLSIPHAVWMTGKASVRQDGITTIGGNFYQDAATNVFYKSGGTFASLGKIVFFRNNGAGDAGVRRYVTSKSGDIDAFDRGKHFVAFPEIEIRTRDTLTIPARMGIDLLRLVRDTLAYGSSLGKLWLESKVINDGSGDKSYDASLRVTGATNLPSEQLLPPGSVVIERDLTPYRVEDGTSGSGTLFAFASPFKHQRSGYFAGNWIRKMLEDDNGHVEYVYGNRRDANNVILGEQYIIDSSEAFEPGKGYLVKLRKTGFPYSELIGSGGLVLTGGNAADYDVSKFIFNGAPYRMPSVHEQVFAEDVLFERSISLEENAFPVYINWIIGNSWTSPIDIKALVDLMGSSPLYFEPSIYVFPYGSTNYQVYQCLSTEDGMQIIHPDEIPSMSYFMLRLDNTKNQNGTFTLRRNELLTHGNASHSSLRRSTVPAYNNEVLFRVSPASNPNIYDLAGIGLRIKASPNTDAHDLLKPGNGESSEQFGLYTTSGDGKRLSANIVPTTVDAVPLCFSPGAAGGRFLLEASRLESLQTECLRLEDRKAGSITDLLQTGGIYAFETSPGDDANRFIVHFQPSATTGVKEVVQTTPLPRIICIGNEIIISGLVEDDSGARLQITDLQGRTLLQSTVTQIPEMRLPAPLATGIYIFRMEGKRVFTLKYRR